jgi:DNA-binding PadR family transcriptional regulator
MVLCVAGRSRKVAWVKAALLAFGVVRGEFYGYEAYKLFLEAGRHKWKPSIGTIYKTLWEMVGEGLLERRSVRKTPRRTVYYYRVTEKGVETYLEKALDYAGRTAFWLGLVVEGLARLEEQGYPVPREIVGRLARLCAAASRLIGSKE